MRLSAPVFRRMATTASAAKKKFPESALFPWPAVPSALVDIGANLADEAFAGDVEDVLARARAAGVSRIVITGTSVARSAAALELAERHGCWSTAGVHPHDAKSWDGSTEAALRALLAHPRCVAVGECGLDFNRNFSTRAEQEAALLRQLVLAADLRKPLFVHCRDAHQRLVELLKGHVFSCPVVVHCFTGNLDEALELLALSPLVYIGFTGWLCDSREGRDVSLAQVVHAVPIERLLLECVVPCRVGLCHFLL